jgi:hypothetical protein
MSGLYVAVPLPPFHHWRLVDHPDACPDAHVIIAQLSGGKRRPVQIADGDVRTLLQHASANTTDIAAAALIQGLVAALREIAGCATD